MTDQEIQALKASWASIAPLSNFRIRTILDGPVGARAKLKE